MKKIFVGVICLVSLIGIFVPKFVSAEKITVSGALTSDTTWSYPNVYVIDSSFNVPAGLTLTIEPGVIIKGRATGYEGSMIYGTLIARGTETQPIHFTSFWNDELGGDTDGSGPSVGNPGEWQGLYFKPGSEGIFEHVDLSYAGYGGYGYGNHVGIENDGGIIDIKYSNIHKNFLITSNGAGGLWSIGSGIYNKSGTLSITHSIIENNTVGVRIDSGDANISNNEIKNNVDSTGYSQGYGVAAYGFGQLTLLNNNFSGNNRTAIIEASKEFIHSGNNSSDLKRRAFQISGLLSQDTTLAAGDLPYIIESLTVPEDITLTIEPGVIIKMEDRYASGSIYVHGGNLIAKGTAENKIHITSLRDDSVGGDTNGDGDATIPTPRSWASIFLEDGSTAEFDHVMIAYGGFNWNGEYMNVPASIYQRGAELSISNSLLKDNHGAVIYQDAGNTTISKSELTGDHGLFSRGGAATISQSSLVMTGYGVYNDSGKDLGWWWETQPLQIIDARNNWWGSADGPNDTYAGTPTGSGTMVTDNVLYTPFLTKEPSSYQTCCSNVLFLPGMKGSVLKKINTIGINDTLWPPTIFSNDVSQLALNENGQSIYPIKVDGILNKFYSTSIYEDFSSFMNNLQAIDSQTGTSTIKEWLPLAYDWRYSPEKIITDGIQTYNGGHIDVIARIEELAQNSNTGKVTIVAHSMGGLLGKAIIRELIERGKTNLVDSFVMVASPQLGTPQAIATVLHGEGEGILGGIIVDKSDIRAIAQNMQSAYNLLPAEEYFTKVNDPVVKFAEVDFTENWRTLWGDSLDNYEELRLFTTGADGRSSPDSIKLLEPEVIRSDLLENAKIFHQTYDNFQFPTSIRMVQIAGWGLPTLKAIEYKKYHWQDSYKGVFTKEGDGTVVYPSAISTNSENIYYIDLFHHNQNLNKNNQHRDILSANPVKEIIKNIIHSNSIEDISYISRDKPQISDLSEQLLVSTHSPVILGAYDVEGNFTGVEPNQNQSLGFLQIKEEIPGSSFVSLGDSQYIFLPKEGSYNFVFSGTGSGEVTVEIENFADDTTGLIASFTDIPVTETSQASFTVQSSEPLKTKIQIDENGDGEIDSLILPDNTNSSLSDLLQILKDKITALNIKDKIRKNLLKRIDNLEKKIERKKEQNVKILEKLEKNINIKTKNGKIDVNSADEILNLIDELDLVSNSIPLNSDLLLNLQTKIESLNIKPTQKRSLIIRVEKLEKKQMIVNTLIRLNNQINKNQNNGKMSEGDANEIIKILEQIESLL